MKEWLLGLLGRHHWTEIAQFGHVFLVLPAAAIVAATLLAGSRRREAAVWCLAVLCCAALTFVLKSVFGNFEVSVLGHIFKARSFPSGHVALASVFYGGLAWLGWRMGTPFSKAIAACLLGLVCLVAVAVVVVGWHHTLDIVFGAMIGGGMIVLAAMLLERRGAAP